VDNGQTLQDKQMIQFSKSKMAAVCYGPNVLLKYFIRRTGNAVFEGLHKKYRKVGRVGTGGESWDKV